MTYDWEAWDNGTHYDGIIEAVGMQDALDGVSNLLKDAGTPCWKIEVINHATSEAAVK